MPWPPPVTTATRPLRLKRSRYIGSQASATNSSAHPVAAVDVERLRDDVVAVGGGEEHGGAGMVFGQSHPAERRRITDEALLFRRAADARIDAAPALNDALDGSLDRRRLGDVKRDGVGLVAMAGGGFLRVVGERNVDGRSPALR